MTFNMSLIKKSMLAAALVAVIGGSAAYASHHNIKDIDVNGDQQISQTEFLTGANARFDAADTNGDNFLDTEERRIAKEKRREKRAKRAFDKVDANNDGAITEAELDAMRAKRKAKRQERLDTNNDGQVSQGERDVAKADRRAKKDGKKARINPDTNDDGFISRDEHQTMALNMFERLDANNDGVLTKGEGKKRKRKSLRGLLGR